MEYINLLKSVQESIKEKELLENIYDTEVFRELEQKLKPAGKMSPQEMERIGKLLATPSALPRDFDRTMEAWLLRISIWGKLSIRRKDPEEKVNRTMRNMELVSYLGDTTRNSLRGRWDAEELDLNKIRFFRAFWSVRGKKVTEEIIVTIDLRPDLKKAIKKMRSKLGWFSR